jgi:hypothetical protein
VLEKYLDYASAVRQTAPEIELGGPVVCCWYDYWNPTVRPEEEGPGIPNDYIAWFLNAVREYDAKAGQTSLDVLDVHYYPQGGIYSQDVDQDTAARRLRSTRALWDRTYVDESWINQPIYFIPRMREAIDQYYPGLRLGISEWNWGADTSMNGALAIAEVWGIFGREGVDFASYWRFPPLESPGFFAMRMYTNYDGQGSRFGGEAGGSSVWTQSSDMDRVSSYAALEEGAGTLYIMLINKQLQEAIPVQVQLQGYESSSQAILYRYDQSNLNEIIETTVEVSPGGLETDLPPYSISLFVMAK